MPAQRSTRAGDGSPSGGGGGGGAPVCRAAAGRTAPLRLDPRPFRHLDRVRSPALAAEGPQETTKTSMCFCGVYCPQQLYRQTRNGSVNRDCLAGQRTLRYTATNFAVRWRRPAAGRGARCQGLALPIDLLTYHMVCILLHDLVLFDTIRENEVRAEFGPPTPVKSQRPTALRKLSAG